MPPPDHCQSCQAPGPFPDALRLSSSELVDVGRSMANSPKSSGLVGRLKGGSVQRGPGHTMRADGSDWRFYGDYDCSTRASEKGKWALGGVGMMLGGWG